MVGLEYVVAARDPELTADCRLVILVVDAEIGD